MRRPPGRAGRRGARRTPAYPAFGDRPPVLQPLFGGGPVAAAAIPLIVEFGPAPLPAVMTVLPAASPRAGLPPAPPRGPGEARGSDAGAARSRAHWCAGPGRHPRRPPRP
ncbi:hypothetical protein GCM10009834_18530 [Streptomonospora arabica]